MDNREHTGKENRTAIRNVLILGAGTMGLQIGLQCAASGFEVMVYDPFEQALEKAQQRLGSLAGRMAGANRITPEQAEAGASRMQFSSDPVAAGKNADFINESIPEDPALKQKVFAAFNEICPAHTVFTTNTSTLVPSMIAGATGRPDRFAAFHFHDCMLTNVVDIMPHPGTSPDTLEIIREFCRAIGQFPVELKKEQNGYVFNTMLGKLLEAALALAAKDVADVADIDRAWMGIMRTGSGPFGIMDAIGLGTVYKVTDYWAEKRDDAQARKSAAFLKTYVDRGDLGVKTGKGFYSYPKPAFMSSEFMQGIR